MAEQEARVTVAEGLGFSKVNGQDLLCDVFTPPGLTGPAPAILLIHGGAWMLGDRTQLKGYGFLFGREGYVCVAMQYRLSGQAKWPAQMQDVQAALAWMHENHQKLGIDPNRIAMLGHSSGGHMALMAAGQNLVTGGPKTCGIISFYAPVELTKGAEWLKEPIEKMLGKDAGADAYAKASPINLVKPGFPPTLILQSSTDDIVPRQQSLIMYEKMLAAGCPVELHMFDRIQHALDASKEMSRLSVALITNFLTRHCG